MVLCYLFLPVYRALGVYTLSEYLGRRYDDRSRIAYAIIMVIIMAVVQMVPGLYIGARSLCVMAGGNAVEEVTLDSAAEGDAQTAAPVTKLNVNQTYYIVFVIVLALVAAGYTIFGGLKAVVWTDVIQTVLMLLAAIIVAVLTFREIGGWGAMRELDAAGANRMHLYLPMNHPQLPWTGVFTGLMAMHCAYWGTNQAIVQRALGARSDAEAGLGIVAAGFLKLLIPFFAIGTGIAAFYLFQQRLGGRSVDPDAAFPELVKLVVLPLGSGIVGLIAAGLIGAILSSIVSMMNSAATIVTVDVYKRYVQPNATDRQMINVGRWSIAVFCVMAALMAILVLDPNSERNFFLQVADYQNYLTPGLLVAFVLGMFWRRGTATGAFVTIVAGVVLSWVVVYVYDNHLGMNPEVYEVVIGRKSLEDADLTRFPTEAAHLRGRELDAWIASMTNELTLINRHFGGRINFFHRVAIVIVLCVVVHVAVSLKTQPGRSRGPVTWMDVARHSDEDFRRLRIAIASSLCVFVLLGAAMVYELLRPGTAGVAGAIWTALLILRSLIRSRAAASVNGSGRRGSIASDDRFWAALLCATTVFMHYYFY